MHHRARELGIVRRGHLRGIHDAHLIQPERLAQLRLPQLLLEGDVAPGEDLSLPREAKVAHGAGRDRAQLGIDAPKG